MKPFARSGAVIGLIVLAALVAGCASPDRAPTKQSTDVFTVPPTKGAPATPTTAAAVDPQCDPNNPSASLRPAAGPTPAPGQMPPGSTMAAIQARGRLRVGVDQNTLLFGYRDPRTGDLAGFDIDVAHEIARAIFGDPNAIDYKVVTTAQRQEAIAPSKGDPTVDMVASLYTINCSRWHDMSFSTEYYRAAQGLLVERDAPINSLADLAGKRICATTGSTASTNPLLTNLQPKPTMHLVSNRTECLVALQDGQVDAIAADDTILYGFETQDRTTRLLDQRISVEPYGLAMNKGNPDLVRFVNGVLERMRADGTLAALEAKWLGGTVSPLPPIPDASYRN